MSTLGRVIADNPMMSPIINPHLFIAESWYRKLMTATSSTEKKKHDRTMSKSSPSKKIAGGYRA